MPALEIIFWFAVCAIAYVFWGYPLALFVAGSLVRSRPRPEMTQLPHVSLIISAYNEEKVLGEKLENSLSIEYPRDKFEIIVVSDASTDRTDAIAEGYGPEGVVLKRMPTRGGKTTGLNAVVPFAKGEIIVFSDANALYEPDAVEKLVRNFADPAVGCVTGDSRYIKLATSYVGENEDTYWDYERSIKIKESHLGSMVGGDGAIFAIRKHLFQPLKAEDINDFVIPLQIVSMGYRCIFEPAAVCYENTVVHFEEEFRRKVRVVNRSWNGLFRVKQLLNPLRYGWFSVQLVSHKMLRWLTPFFLLMLLGSSLTLASKHWIYLGTTISQVGLYALGVLGLALTRFHIRNRWLSLPWYFLLINVASVVGLAKYIRGERINIWEPEREGREHAGGNRHKMLRCSALLGVGAGLCLAITLWPKASLWTASGMLLYTYIGYPSVCLLLGRFLYRPWRQSDIQPTVTLLIVAHNEEACLKAKIANSLELEYPAEKFTIMLASDGSTDGTNAIMQRAETQGIRTYYFSTRGGKMAAINRIFPDIQTDIVVLSDANVFYKPDAITKLVRNFADEAVGAVSGKVTLVSDRPVPGLAERLYYRYEWLIQRFESYSGSLVGVDGAMYGIRRELFQPLPNTVVIDDFIISMNVAKRGKRVVYEPEARANEASAASLGVEMQRRIRIIAGAIQSLLRGEGVPELSQPFLLWKYLSHKVLRWISPVFLVMLFGANVLLLYEPLYVVVFAGQMLVYGTAFVGAWQKSPAWGFGIPLYFCAVNMAAIIGLVRGVLGQQKEAWDRLERSSGVL
jgi:cellulose synthase/poly-beta-1,6-N-acetylglucosamine synthase-like glycosyltransferase